jgi:hypothetical protein
MSGDKRFSAYKYSNFRIVFLEKEEEVSFLPDPNIQ